MTTGISKHCCQDPPLLYHISFYLLLNSLCLLLCIFLVLSVTQFWILSSLCHWCSIYWKVPCWGRGVPLVIDKYDYIVIILLHHAKVCDIFLFLKYYELWQILLYATQIIDIFKDYNASYSEIIIIMLILISIPLIRQTFAPQSTSCHSVVRNIPWCSSSAPENSLLMLHFLGSCAEA